MPLTLKQERFVDEYLIDLNATQAAIRGDLRGPYWPCRHFGGKLYQNTKFAL
jgi:hypothetical protein